MGRKKVGPEADSLAGGSRDNEGAEAIPESDVEEVEFTHSTAPLPNEKKPRGCVAICNPSAKTASQWTAEEGTMAGPLKKDARTHTDALCVVWFLIFLLVEVSVCLLGWYWGDVARLLNPTDYWGNTCGYVNGSGYNLTDKSLAHYPRLAEDVALALQNAEECSEDAATGTLSEECTVSLYTVCVTSCPRAGDILCSYEKERLLAPLSNAQTWREYYASTRDGCWIAPLDTDSKFSRCIPMINVAHTDDYTCNGVAMHYSKIDDCTGVLTHATSTTVNSTGGAGRLVEALVTNTAVIKQEIADVYSVMPEILYFGFGGAFVVAWSFVLLMQVLAACVVWSIIVLVWLIIFTTTVGFFLRTENFWTLQIPSVVTDPVRGLLQELTDSPVAVKLAADDTLFEAYDITAHVLFVVTVAFICLIISLRERIRFTITVLKIASKTMQAAKLLPFFPLTTWLSHLVVITFFTTFGALIYTAHISEESLSAAYETAKSSLDCDGANLTSITACISTAASAVGQGLTSGGQGVNATLDLTAPEMNVEDSDLVDFFLLFHLFMFLWIIQFFDAFALMSMAATVSEVYWTKQRHKDEKRWATFDGFFYVLKYHIGTTLFGAFLVAVVQFIRIIIAYFKKQIEQVLGNSKAVKYALCIVDLILACFERVVKYITRNAYIMCAINGTNFCTSAYSAFKLIIKNGARVAVAQSTAFFLKYLAILGIAAVSTFSAYLLFAYHPEFQEGGARPIYSYEWPCSCVATFSVMIAMAFLHVFTVSIDTVLFSFLWDEAMLSKNKYDGIEALKDPKTGVAMCVTEKDWPVLYSHFDKDVQQQQEAAKAKHLESEKAKNQALAGGITHGGTRRRRRPRGKAGTDSDDEEVEFQADSSSSEEEDVGCCPNRGRRERSPVAGHTFVDSARGLRTVDSRDSVDGDEERSLVKSSSTQP